MRQLNSRTTSYSHNRWEEIISALVEVGGVEVTGSDTDPTTFPSVPCTLQFPQTKFEPLGSFNHELMQLARNSFITKISSLDETYKERPRVAPTCVVPESAPFNYRTNIMQPRSCCSTVSCVVLLLPKNGCHHLMSQ